MLLEPAVYFIIIKGYGKIRIDFSQKKKSSSLRTNTAKPIYAKINAEPLINCLEGLYDDKARHDYR